MRIDVDEFDAELPRPQAALRAFEARVAAVGALGIAGPEDDHLGFLQAILHAAVAGAGTPMRIELPK